MFALPLTLFAKYFGFWHMSRIGVLAPLNYVFLDIHVPSSLCQNQGQYHECRFGFLSTPSLSLPALVSPHCLVNNNISCSVSDAYQL